MILSVFGKLVKICFCKIIGISKSKIVNRKAFCL